MTHEQAPTAASGFERKTDTYSSAFAFSPADSSRRAQSHFKSIRDRQFVESATKPGATRQSYQDSDIFGYKRGNETVQKSATKGKDLRGRSSNTYAMSNVMGNNEHVAKKIDTERKPKPVSRVEEKWDSGLFGRGTKADQAEEMAKRKWLAKGDQGTEGLFGKEKAAW